MPMEWSPDFSALPPASIESYLSDTEAFDILSTCGLNDAGIKQIKSQVEALSKGYRRPDIKLDDVLDGGVAIVDSDYLFLLHGFGSLDRGLGSGECSEATRYLASTWANSSQHRYLAKAGLHPFYLEVASPRLFMNAWEHNGRVRGGHSVLALGSPNDYIQNGTDRTFVIIDPTLGVIQPMASSTYRQTAFKPVPEKEDRICVVPMAIRHGDQSNDRRLGADRLILGIDESARFAFSLSFRAFGDSLSAQLQAINGNNEVIASFDSASGEVAMPSQAEAASFTAAEETFVQLIEVLLRKGIRHHDAAITEGNAILADGKSLKISQELRYPRDRKLADSLAGLDKASETAQKTGMRFSLAFEEPATPTPHD